PRPAAPPPLTRRSSPSAPRWPTPCEPTTGAGRTNTRTGEYRAGTLAGQANEVEPRLIVEHRRHHEEFTVPTSDTSLLRRWRRDLHQIPELGLQEHRTGDYMAEALAAMGLDVTRGIGSTGLVATVRGDAPGPERAVALRADMDGLPLTERVDRPHRSRHEGVMHACGHDGHMAMVLGAGHVLAAEGGFAGAVHLVFQPAEEHGLGARAMIADGLFERFPVDAVFGLHNMP